MLDGRTIMYVENKRKRTKKKENTDHQQLILTKVIKYIDY